ncbi:MAG TPA: DUF2779 domain-containing protein [Sphingobacteriaceae bacterium]|nr:DUF2779 domain-containing protein [Sphingobacteriaceae bacterium]
MSSPPRHILSKSTFMYGCQCPKRLWLHKFMPQVRDEADEAQTAIFQQGTNVGLLAQQLFPGGIDASPVDTFSYQQSVADTARYISEGHSVIYEAAFQYEGILCAVDMLVKKGDKWFAYEVKSSTGVKDPFVQDAALQYYVITNTGLPLADFFIVHLNRTYIRYGDLDIPQLFSSASVLDRVQELQPFITGKIAELKDVLKLKDAPAIEVGTHCEKPYPCDFYGFCSKDTEEEQPDYGEANINEEAIRAFVGTLQYPLYFMDFETWMTAVPEYDGHWPYRQVNFQFSVHVQQGPDAPLQHVEYLADGPHSPQQEFIETLLAALGTEGSIVVFNRAFENTRLRELKAEFPSWEKTIMAAQERIVDLMVPFRRKEYYLTEMKDSYSIKSVLPAMVPELSYASLPIGNGTDASAAFFNLRHVMNDEEKQATRLALLEYCKLDTLAMVKILEKLKGI